MSLETLRAFLATATAEQVARLDSARLPERIPRSFYDEVPPGLREAFNQLIFEANSNALAARMDLEDLFGADVVAGIDMARQYAKTDHFASFVQQISSVQMALSRSGPVTHTEFRSLTLQIRNMDNLLKELTNESIAIFRARDVLLRQAQKPISDEAKFSKALHDLEDQHKRIDRVVSQYYYVRLLVIGREMEQTRKRAEHLDAEAGKVQFKIDRHREELEAIKNSGGSLFHHKKKERMQALQEIISELFVEKQKHEVVISENDLTSWLDALVDACISPLIKDKVDKFARNVRLVLFQLLERYCVLQEEAALQVARNPFTQIDPKKTIRYLLQSEQFILDYFARKKSNLTAWLGGAAKRRIELMDELETDLLTELRRNSKLTRR